MAPEERSPADQLLPARWLMPNSTLTPEDTAQRSKALALTVSVLESSSVVAFLSPSLPFLLIALPKTVFYNEPLLDRSASELVSHLLICSFLNHPVKDPYPVCLSSPRQHMLC